MDSFPADLQPDPSVALRPPLTGPLRTGPLHKVQYVIELVGPRSVPAQAAAALNDPRWSAALGEPQVFAMTAADETWRVLPATVSGSYDSLALAWDLLSPRGALNAGSAGHLPRIAEEFGQAISRRAMPMPTPNDVDRQVRHLRQIGEQLDVGYEVSVLGEFRERDIWAQCARLGLDLGPDGAFEWKPADTGAPMLGVTPLGGAYGFSLASAQSGTVHPGVGIGFSVPKSADPMGSLEACFHVADVLARELRGQIFDEDDRPLNDRARQQAASNLRLAINALVQADLEPGSAEALRLFA